MTYRQTNDVTYTAVQDGSYVSGGWEESLDGVALLEGGPSPSVIGLTFDLGTNLQSAGGILCDPPLIQGASLTLTTHSSVVADPGSTVVELYVVPAYAPADYSVTLFPFNRSELLVAASTFTWAGAPTTLTFTFGTYEGSASSSVTCAANLERLRLVYWANSQWSGRVALSIKSLTGGVVLTFASLESSGETAAALTTTELKYFTGVLGWPLRQARAVRCPKTGLPFLADEAVQDGYRKGMWVSPRGFDPEDRTGKDFFPSPDEGVIKDKVS